MSNIVLIMLAFFSLIYLISSWSTTRQYKLDKLKEQEKHLLTMIEYHTLELDNLKQQRENNQINNTVNLSNMVNNVLDIYKESNIQIPVDIIESLVYTNLQDDKEVFLFIENQRNYWKLENTKKPFSKV